MFSVSMIVLVICLNWVSTKLKSDEKTTHVPEHTFLGPWNLSCFPVYTVALLITGMSKISLLLMNQYWDRSLR